MSEDFGDNYLTLTDEDGNEFTLEVLGDVEFEGSTYTVFLPENIDEMDTDDPDYGFVILKQVLENGEEVYASVDDEEELNNVYEFYMNMVEDDGEPEDEE